MLKINTCPTISYTSQPEKSITKTTQIENKNSNNKLLLVGMTALGILSVGGLLLNTKCVSKNIKTNLPNTMREVIQNINEDAIKTKQAVNDLASGSLFKQENKASEEYFNSIESYHDIIDKNWTLWQRDCDSLKYNFGHKALFEHFALSPKQLSDVHRDIESLHMSLLKYLQTQNSEYEDLIPKLASKILKDGAVN